MNNASNSYTFSSSSTGRPTRAAAINAQQKMAEAKAFDKHLKGVIKEGYGTSQGHWNYTKNGTRRKY